jgi:hypothetical protein
MKETARVTMNGVLPLALKKNTGNLLPTMLLRTETRNASIPCVIQKENAQGAKKRTVTGKEKEKGTGIDIIEITIETEVRGMTGVEGELKIASGIEVMIMTGTEIMIVTEREGTGTDHALVQGANQGITPDLVHAHALEANGQVVLTWHHLVLP